MNIPPKNVALDRLLAWHEHVTTLAAAGVAGRWASNDAQARRELSGYVGRIALSVGRGTALPEAIAHEPDLPADYRAAALMAVDGNEEAALELLFGRSRLTDKLRSAARGALTTPIVLLVLALLGGVAFSVYLAPSLAAIYVQIEQRPDAATRFLLSPTTRLVALGVVVLLLLAAIAWRSYGGRTTYEGRLSRRAGGRRAAQAALAERVAWLIRHGLGTGDALRTASASTTANAEEQCPPRTDIGEATPAASAAADPSIGLPPLMAWALTRSEDPAVQVSDLALVADVYREAAGEQLDRWRRWAPAIVGSLLGGLIVLAYGLTVFIPVVRLLETLSQPS